MNGTLKDRSVSDLLMWCAQERKTGVLLFERRRTEIQLDWIDGEIVNVAHRPAPAGSNLGDLLLHIGEITEAQLEQAILQQKRSLSPLGLVLQNLFGCEPERIRFVLRVQAVEAFYTLLFWDSGDFSFTQKAVDLPRNAYQPLDAVELLHESKTVVEAWISIRKYFPEPLIMVRRLTDDIPEETLERLDELPYALFELLERQCTFRELSILSGAGQFATGYALVQLLQLELVRFEAAKKDRLEVNRLLFGGSVSDFVVWLTVSGLLVCGGTFLLAFAPYSPLRFFQPQGRLRVPDTRWHRRVDHWRQRRIRRALENYRLSKGSYPKKLTGLTKGGWLARGLIRFPQGKTYYYKRIGLHRYLLLPPVP